MNIIQAQLRARNTAENLNAAYWVAPHNEAASDYLLSQAHAAFADLADAMGYTVTKKEAGE